MIPQHPELPDKEPIARRLAVPLYRRYQRWRSVRECVKLFGIERALRDPENKSYRDEIRSYWKAHYGKPVHPAGHIACTKVTGTKDPRYIPEFEWYREILPVLNQLRLRTAFRDKNLSDVFLSYAKAPTTVLKRMHGRYYDADNSPISFDAASKALASGPKDLIIKPSQTDNGFGVRSLVVSSGDLSLDGVPCGFDELETQYGSDFIVQERIVQHRLMAEVHPASVNTVRVVTFRWGDDIRVLLALTRFGTDGRLTDNAATGGVFCGIDEQGRLNDSAVDMAGTVYARHPTTGFDFAKDFSIPDYERLCQLTLDLHRQIFHFDIVSWDIAIGVDGEPIFLEVNFQGAPLGYQIACRRPLFGELTQDVLNFVRDKRRQRGL